MSQDQTMIQVAGTNLPVVIKDVRNIVLQSAELTQIVVSAITRLARDVIQSGLREIVLIIDSIHTEIDLIFYSGRQNRKLRKFRITVEMYDKAKKDAESSKYQYDSAFIAEWIRRIEEEFYREMAGIN
ncbi:hypothetical protein EYB53_022085 [Candidatus Chloroploca sp. M-50]|uniref:Uncharacterized protein n=1 Tax=Candidatus Chloroploca mongolica TaxID=2528176 RepID=A0ABS4DG58_9CHLR|nr:hypothetical protein [Candidatus Chloroploca mongolica]MBP1468418.1 hypothetical protein [Candidatus Chloroploca mongolica]